MINIIYSEEYKEQAATRIRIIEPLRFLIQTDDFACQSLQEIIKKNTVNGSFKVDNPDFKKADILYLFITDVNHTNLNLMAPILNYFLDRNKPIVTNLDDHYFNIPEGITVKEEMEKNEPIFRQLLKVSKLVLVTGNELKKEITPINPAVITVPNMIDPMAYQFRNGHNDKLRIGWCGLPSHFADLVMVLPAIKLLAEKFPIQFTIFGLFNSNMKHTIKDAQESGMNIDNLEKKFPKGHFILDALKMAQHLEGVPYTHIPLVPYTNFPTTLAEVNFDIGICPLQDTLFNRCKSAIKFAQYAAVGTPTIASGVYPYTVECNYLADNSTDGWYGKLAAMIENKTLRNDVLALQRKYVLENRNYIKGTAIYELLFKKIIG